MSNATPGRPAIGPKVPINFSTGLLSDIDQAADLARTSRAAWVRRAVTRALPEDFQGPITPDQLGPYLRGSSMGEDLDNPDRDVHVDNDTALRLLRAVDDGALTFGAITTESASVETERSRRNLSFITRPFIAHGEEITVYQVSYTTFSARQPGEPEGVYHRQRTLYLDHDAAKVFYEDMHDSYMK
ncbi:hypothetical protein ABT186_10985 [Streptomyces sp. NPDC001634]|uniref:hypothetical protein n=1 Tax=Streptomyces sp. NPDC001634 TaxID=3154390 RepID=UPI003317FEF9